MFGCRVFLAFETGNAFLDACGDFADELGQVLDCASRIPMAGRLPCGAVIMSVPVAELATVIGEFDGAEFAATYGTERDPVHADLAKFVHGHPVEQRPCAVVGHHGEDGRGDIRPEGFDFRYEAVEGFDEAGVFRHAVRRNFARRAILGRGMDKNVFAVRALDCGADVVDAAVRQAFGAGGDSVNELVCARNVVHSVSPFDMPFM